MKRREFIFSSIAAGSFIAGCSFMDFSKKGGESLNVAEGEPRIESKPDGRVYLIKTSDRKEGIEKLMNEFDLSRLKGKKVAVKANYNSADEFPATTHPETLESILETLKKYADSITIAERSGMGDTGHVLRETGVEEIASRYGTKVVVLDRASEWVRFDADHWKKGFLFADAFYRADHVIQTCCLKTHRFGGHFTLSLKNSVGMVARYWNGYDYMAELHSSPHQRKMIAEINIAYSPFLVIMDAIEGFSEGGPDKGKLIKPELIVAGKDRVAVDAVGVALLRVYGTTPEVSRGGVFDQEQIRRAVELGIGVGSADEIELIPLNREAEEITEKIQNRLSE